ncbi:hypothetical protein ACH5RR_023687 [Cinchona calisaya]|uniref:Uncharacterized protein n=1 Tax=Cinchona calisaya TaxID=153742 RepID=A0ABD2ZBC5_9GENT
MREKRTLVDSSPLPKPTAKDGGKGGGKCGEDDRAPPLPPFDAPCRRKKKKKTRKRRKERKKNWKVRREMMTILRSSRLKRSRGNKETETETETETTTKCLSLSKWCCLDGYEACGEGKAIKLCIIEKPLLYPYLNDARVANGEANVGGVNNVEMVKKLNENAVKLEAQLTQQSGLSIGLQIGNDAEPIQSGRFTGAERRKSGSVKRFKQEIGSGVPDDCRNIVAVGFDSMANDLHRITRVESSRNICDIIEIIKPVSYSSSITNNIQHFLVTFMAKRLKFLKKEGSNAV